jgi:lysophospholipase L1-like esterase
MGEVEMTAMKLCTTTIAVVLAGVLAPALVHAQTQASQPVAATQAAPAAKASWHPDNEYWRHHDQLLQTDFPWLARFKEENLKFGPPAAGEKRVVFMGDSITEGWHLDKSFPGKPYINRGISGQTTPQMVLRFHQDVIALKPRVVVILGGINDIAENTGPMTLEQTENNFAAMTEMAKENGIKVVLCSVLPAVSFSWHPGMTPAPLVAELNKWIKNYAAEKGVVYVDYYSAMKDERGGLPASLSRDGVHPLPAGQAIMVPLVQAGIDKALKSRF